MTLPRSERHAIVVAAAAVLVLLGLAATQYVRTAWPFAGDRRAPLVAASLPDDAHAAHGAAPPGYTGVTLEPAQAEAIGLASAPVEQRDLDRKSVV